MRRATAIISGRVQGIGYRNIVDDVAYKHKINGHVKNLKDRTVEVVAEGEESSLKGFFNEININESPVHVDDISITWDNPTNKYTYFDIIRGDPSEEIGERMDIANILLVNMNKKQDTMIGKQDTMIGKQDTMIEKQDIMIEKQDTMIDLQTDNNSEMRGMRKDIKISLDSRFSEIQDKLIDIESALIKAGIKI